MAREGLLIDYEFCTGCHTCEIACQMEHGFPVGKELLDIVFVKYLCHGSWILVLTFSESDASVVASESE